MTINKEKILSILSNRSMSESTLSKKSGIPITDLRPILGNLCDEKTIEHMGKLIWLKKMESK